MRARTVRTGLSAPQPVRQADQRFARADIVVQFVVGAVQPDDHPPPINRLSPDDVFAAHLRPRQRRHGSAADGTVRPGRVRRLAGTGAGRAHGARRPDRSPLQPAVLAALDPPHLAFCCPAARVAHVPGCLCTRAGDAPCAVDPALASILDSIRLRLGGTDTPPRLKRRFSVSLQAVESCNPHPWRGRAASL